MPISPPLSMRGYVDDSTAYGSLLADFSDTIGDCLFPASTETYRQMRRHSQLAAVEKAYSLSIRRATWSLNPAGCRPEVVQLVADDLGLPVAGKDEPGAARTRGVSWPDHLRLALLSLTYGFSAFEMLAEVRDGNARLVELSERLPATVNEFHTDRVGRLTGISQDVLVGAKSTGAPQIKADRLVLYSREREGAAYWGNSILRPAFPAWFLSREMIKVHATANRRFGMGVPTVEWGAGTNPTPAQITQAQQAASAARVGEESGASFPPGSRLALVGQSGGTPDTLAFLRYLDHVMASQALAGFIDLGTTQTGSRALAGEFIDLFQLAITSEALAIADVATRQVAARIVEWNFGDEPVPAVQVSDIGAQHDVTAESLQALLASGALSADPGLEAHIRRMYRLPERETPAVPVTAPGVDLPKDTASGAPGLAADDSGAVVASAATEDVQRPASRRKPSPRRQPSGQLALNVAAAVDNAGQDDHADAIQTAWTSAVATLLAQWPALSLPLVDALTAQAVAAVTSGDVAALGSLAAPADVVAALTESMTALAVDSAAQVVAEAAAQGVSIATVEPDASQLAGLATVAASLIASGYATAAARKALQVGPDGVEDAVRTALEEMSAAGSGWVADNVGAALSQAQNAGRAAVFAAHPPRALKASEVNDRSRCVTCAQVDQREYGSLDEAFADYGPTGSGYARCLGGSRCRGHLIAVWN